MFLFFHHLPVNCFYKFCSDMKKSVSSVIMQKGESQNGFSTKQSTPNFPNNKHFLPYDTHTYVRNVHFSKKLRVLFSGNTRFKIFPFALLLRDLEFPSSNNRVTDYDVIKPS